MIDRGRMERVNYTCRGARTRQDADRQQIKNGGAQKTRVKIRERLLAIILIRLIFGLFGTCRTMFESKSELVLAAMSWSVSVVLATLVSTTKLGRS